MKDIINFKRNGYIVKRNLISKKSQEEIFYLLYDLAVATIKKNKKLSTKIRFSNIEDVSYPKDLKLLDRLLLSILKINKDYIGEIYDTVSYSSTFLKFITNSKMEFFAKKLLDLKKFNTIYSWTHRIRIDPPKDKRRTYGWHQEIFYTIPDTRFIQTWCPIVRNTTIKNGTIEICPKSHSKGIANQTWNEINGRATQILVNENVVNNFQKKKMPMKTGDVLFFDPHLFHRSGNNTSDEIRFSVVGMLNDATSNKFKAPIPSFEPRTITPKKRYERFFKRKVI